MLVHKKVCDMCSEEIAGDQSGSIVLGRRANGEDLFPKAVEAYGGRYYDLCESCTEKILRMFSVKKEAK